MVYNREFPGRVRFIAHAVREIRNRLPDVIAGPKGGGIVQYINKLDELALEWEQSGLPMNESLPTKVTAGENLSFNEEVPIPRKVYSKVLSLIKDHLEGREKPRDAVKRLFQAIDHRNKNAEATLMPRIEHWLDITKWWVKHVHKWDIKDDEVDADELVSRFVIFEKSLAAIVRGFFEIVEKLDEILEEANT